jgi:hypothetical protein
MKVSTIALSRRFLESRRCGQVCLNFVLDFFDFLPFFKITSVQKGSKQEDKA